MWRNYYTVTSVEEALRLLAEYRGRARIIAGGTDLILELENGQRPGLDTLIDVTRIPGLDHIRLGQDGWVHMGPLVTHNHCANSTLIIERAFALACACWEVGAPQIRNRGTISGNLITASPANDSITPLTALGARLTLRSVNGERTMALDDFYTGVRQTVMREDEMLVDIAFPLPPEGTRSTFYKLGLRRAQAISVINVVAVLIMDGDIVQKAKIILGSVAPSIVHASEAETFLVGKCLTVDTIAQAGDLATQAARPIDDVRSSADYRRKMICVFTMRALHSLAEGKARETYPERPVMLWGADEYHYTKVLAASHCHQAGTPIVTTINDKRYEVETGHHKTLLRFLREDVGLTGTKEGCSEGECGACTIFLDGVAVMSCLVPAPRAHGAEIITVEGLLDNGVLHPVQDAFIKEGAVQCGYCTPGFVMSGVKLLEEIPNPTRLEIQQAITGNLCRCTGYYKIISAIESAAAAMQ
jgi:carbon-monoxide dehydrogenase medium subunit